MSVFDEIDGHEQVLFSTGPGGLRCVIAIHSTLLGPALGGVRFLPYRDEDQAISDALRLSRAMTYKAACAGLDIGGGKAVIFGGAGVEKSEPMLRAFGQAVESLSGRFIAACDMGITTADLRVMRKESQWIRGLDAAEGGSGESGAMTAYGVSLGIRACLRHLDDSESLEGRHVAIDGVGKVGARLATLLAEDGARLWVADIDQEKAERVARACGAEVVSREKLYLLDVDVLSPNAIGNVIDADLVDRLRCRIVAGGANNQLAAPTVADRLAARGVLYAPDFVINALGLIQVVDELHPAGHDMNRVRQRAELIPERLAEIFNRAHHLRISTAAAAISMARDRLAAVRTVRSFWLPPRCA
ncbi:Leu/Phe/Val dehydrogenase [Streptomyces spectabilis]|uniref:Valine dehydrogenase n=1 Tax=Streptomyces spectabilis TaxID=68270 RepID=A0A5P2X0R5_STRST|nr:Glu/Leu/Phe/Val dehydrogenase dimerization domain-containing protein [Streptomyces spectabilis]MBB5101242.1 glutamate dehydrogenase/leucine dehydrogenase [Streptomyces spectabilis]MCI3900442.1 Glu/Leu/Phe/Val dehydrogenase [Streptomyces spectabilis]QEV58021.1 Glu/Leu/Phe/Val dehydrogenase [Streptomyces spectabilis]GGV10189.1 leucine dehydrogenase [Streptomyces spectabilis]